MKKGSLTFKAPLESSTEYFDQAVVLSSALFFFVKPYEYKYRLSRYFIFICKFQATRPIHIYHLNVLILLRVDSGSVQILYLIHAKHCT